MKLLDMDLQKEIKDYIENYCDNYGCGPTIREIAGKFRKSTSVIARYVERLSESGNIAKGTHNKPETATEESKETTRVMKLGYVPCGPLQDITAYCEGYVRLPRSLVGPGKFFILTASGESMIKAGIESGDKILIRQQETAEVGQIIVALVENGVTLKRLGYNEKEQRYYLHPENDSMEDIYVDNIRIQGVATKIIRDIEQSQGET